MESERSQEVIDALVSLSGYGLRLYINLLRRLLRMQFVCSQVIASQLSRVLLTMLLPGGSESAKRRRRPKKTSCASNQKHTAAIQQEPALVDRSTVGVFTENAIKLLTASANYVAQSSSTPQYKRAEITEIDESTCQQDSDPDYETQIAVSPNYPGTMRALLCTLPTTVGHALEMTGSAMGLPSKTLSILKTAPLKCSEYACDQLNKFSRFSYSTKSSVSSGRSPSVMDPKAKQKFVHRLLQAKEASGMTFSDIADQCGVTNVYCAQLFHNQAQLKPHTAEVLKRAVPALKEVDIAEMMRAPVRDYDDRLLHEPHVYRLHEAVSMNGASLKALVNEEFGDGIMSAIDFYVTVDKVKGVSDEDRVVITFNGKFLPHIEQRVEHNTAHRTHSKTDNYSDTDSGSE